MNAPVKSTPSFRAATQDFIDAGISERAIIPIAPHDAKISVKGSLDPKSLGKAPGRYLPREAVWCGLGKNSDGTPCITEGGTAQDTRDWLDWPTANAGLLGRYFPAIDSDAETPEAAALVLEAFEQAFGRGALAAERVRGNSHRRLYAFECTDPHDPSAWVECRTLKYRLPSDLEGAPLHGLDIIGSGRQFVATGVHPSGARYGWREDHDLCDLHETGKLERIDNAIMTRFYDALVALIEARGGEVEHGARGGRGGVERDYRNAEPVMPVEDIFRGLERLPNTEDTFPDRNEFVRFLAALRAALGTEAEGCAADIEAWACADPEWCPPEYFEKAWESLDRGVRVGRHVLDEVFRKNRIFVSAKHAFRNPLTPEEIQGIAACRKAAQEKREALLDAFAKNHVLSRVNTASNNPVCEVRRKADPEVSIRGLDLWMKRTDWVDTAAIDELRKSGRYALNDAGFWELVRDLNRNNPGIVFDGQTLDPTYGRGEIVPEKNPDGSTTPKLNMRYLSPAIRWAEKPPRDPDRAKADVEAWLEFVGSLFGPDADYELDTLAYMAQTGNRPGSFLYLVGEPGVGKTTHIHILEMLFDGPGRNQGAIDGTKLVSEGSRRFALANIEGRRIVSVQELPDNISPAAKAQIASILKQVVDIGGGGDYIQIERKGKDITTVQNFARFAVTTNYENALPVEPNDRRAFCVRCNITAEGKPSSAYYERLAAIGKNPERLAAVWRYLLGRDWRASYDPAKAPPISNAKLEAQIAAIEIPVKRHVAAALALLAVSGREMLDVQELADLASEMSENEYLNTDGAIDDRAKYDFQGASGAGQAALRYLKTEAVKIGGGKDGRGYKVDGGTRRLPVIYALKDAGSAVRLTGAERSDVLDALGRDRRQHPLTDRHPLKRFAGPVEAEGGSKAGSASEPLE